MTESDMRKAARENLRGNWGISVGVTLVAALLGGMAATQILARTAAFS